MFFARPMLLTLVCVTLAVAQSPSPNQDYLLGHALPVREHTTELLNVLFDDGLAGGGMSSQEIEAVLATVAGRLH